jgi:nicotinamidase-related amidase
MTHDYQNEYAPSFTLDPATTALLIIDMQYASGCRDTGLGRMLRERGLEATGQYRFDRIERVVIPNIQNLLDCFRQHDLRVIYVTVGARLPDYSDVPEHLRKLMQDFNNCEGQREHEILDELKPRNGEMVVNKVTHSAFNSSNIETVLRNLGVRNLVFTGISTSQCVETTARDASDRGFRCVLVEDCCAEDEARQHEATLLQFARLFGRVATTDQVIAELKASLKRGV